MMHKYLRQLTQVSIFNFFFILGLLFFVQKNAPLAPQTKMTIKKIIPSVVIESSPIQSDSTQILPTSTVKNIFSELAIHNNKSDCWLEVGEHIYDVTSYFGSHPGGDGPIQKYCGQNATQVFQSKDGIGADHSASAYDLLHAYLLQ